MSDADEDEMTLSDGEGLTQSHFPPINIIICILQYPHTYYQQYRGTNMRKCSYLASLSQPEQRFRKEGPWASESV